MPAIALASPTATRSSPARLLVPGGKRSLLSLTASLPSCGLSRRQQTEVHEDRMNRGDRSRPAEEAGLDCRGEGRRRRSLQRAIGSGAAKVLLARGPESEVGARLSNASSSQCSCLQAVRATGAGRRRRPLQGPDGQLVLFHQLKAPSSPSGSRLQLEQIVLITDIRIVRTARTTNGWAFRGPSLRR